MKQDQFTWNWYPWLLVNHSQWTILEPLYYSSFLFATLVYGVIGINFVDHSLIQGAPAGHESAETPIGHESMYTLRDLPFEIRRQSSFWDIESFFSSDFSEICHDASVFDPLISVGDWFTGCFNSANTLDTRAYFSS